MGKTIYSPFNILALILLGFEDYGKFSGYTHGQSYIFLLHIFLIL